MVRNARVHQDNISAHDHDALKSITCLRNPFESLQAPSGPRLIFLAKQWISESDV